jgi:hypothetical protein
MNEDIQQLKKEVQGMIALGQTEEALALLAASNVTEAILQQGRYANARKQYGIGVIDYSEWNRIQSQINYALIGILDSLEAKSGVARPSSNAAVRNVPKVFVSYNHDDFFAMQSIKSLLESNGIKVIVDTEEIRPGERFEDFIQRALRENAFILTIISKNSLLSGWVSKELTATMLLNNLSQRQWIPVRIDDEMFREEFFFSAISQIDARIQSLREAVQKAVGAGLSIQSFTEELARQEDLKHNFGKILATLKERLVINVTGPLFKPGMEEVLKVIQTPAPQ